MKIQEKKMGGGDGVGLWGLVCLGGQGGCERRIDVFDKFQKKKNFFFFFWGGGGSGRGVGVRGSG